METASNILDSFIINNVPMSKFYRHFKGNVYKVLHVAKHSETLEEYVVYQAMYGERGVWIRPKEMFEETIVRDGVEIKRFTEISEEEIIGI